MSEPKWLAEWMKAQEEINNEVGLQLKRIEERLDELDRRTSGLVVYGPIYGPAIDGTPFVDQLPQFREGDEDLQQKTWDQLKEVLLERRSRSLQQRDPEPLDAYSRHHENDQSEGSC